MVSYKFSKNLGALSKHITIRRGRGRIALREDLRKSH